ncbi:MAG TPA: U32 family peptidase [Candidatus Deferrimicrobium sp.]|nr:U32 family peptidase [Candidatus Deferrimicrobium sp.]
MQFTVATNWDPELIEQLAKLPVRDIYGVANHSIVGSGRPSIIVSEVSEDAIADYIKKVHEKKIQFSYLLNAPCMNNQEYDKKYHRKLIDYIQWISDIGADSVTVSIPLLIQMIKEQFPKLKIRVSTISHVNSVNRAKLYMQLGADEITPDVMINRDFKTLEKMQKALHGKCELDLLLTDGCLYQCPFRHYHYNILGHASQTFQEFDRYYIDTCILNCSIIKFSNPTEVIKARWIRPEDLSHYEALGIKYFKIAGRRMSTDWILRAVKAFSERKYDGNLIDIIQGFDISFGGIEKKDPNARFAESIGKEQTANLVIDNTKLDGFIDFFKKQNCLAMCDECNYCEEWAKKAVVRNEKAAEEYVASIKSYMDDIVSSREFGIKSDRIEDKKKTGIDWNAETQKIFDELIQKSPPQFQSIAKMMVSSLAEGNARGRNSPLVENQDLVKAFLEGTPGPFQAEMRENLQKYGFEIAT